MSLYEYIGFSSLAWRLLCWRERGEEILGDMDIKMFTHLCPISSDVCARALCARVSLIRFRAMSV